MSSLQAHAHRVATLDVLGHLGAMHWKAKKRSRFLRRAGQLTAAVLCLRALIPAGFMLAPVDGHLEMVFCDAAAPKPIHHPPMAHVHDMSGMEHGGPEHAASEHGVTGYAHADPTCPYAQSAGPAPLP